jgi:hypothetical protein
MFYDLCEVVEWDGQCSTWEGRSSRQNVANCAPPAASEYTGMTQ